MAAKDNNRELGLLRALFCLDNKSLHFERSFNGVVIGGTPSDGGSYVCNDAAGTCSHDRHGAVW